MEKRIQKNLIESYWENIKSALLDKMTSMVSPVCRNSWVAVEEMLDDPYHAELNAYYYMQRGQVLAEVYSLPVFDWEAYHALREESTKKAYAMWELHEQTKREFFLSVAEELWGFSSFSRRYGELFSQEEIENYYAYCKKIFIEERIFLQPEWLLFSSMQWQGKEQFLYENACVEFFCRNHANALKLLPICVLQNKTFKKMLSKKFKCKVVA